MEITLSSCTAIVKEMGSTTQFLTGGLWGLTPPWTHPGYPIFNYLGVAYDQPIFTILLLYLCHQSLGTTLAFCVGTTSLVAYGCNLNIVVSGWCLSFEDLFPIPGPSGGQQKELPL